ncbi:hypothetical protein AY601_0454 [Pedobacter cryoconitis]|uniref:Uncharacterized protein n=2 Tax=Pedobacter cryoconitis TaxID=188932 RepID=A0A127V826_9SPHI|nr:hypothetical protein AY601_0454 [Pedobacter cryoconitis]
MLPFQKGTRILLRQTVDLYSNLASLQFPKNQDQVRVVSYKGGILLLAVIVPKAIEQRVSIKVTEDFLLVSCSSHQGEKYLSYYASLSLNYLLCKGDSADFQEFY